MKRIAFLTIVMCLVWISFVYAANTDTETVNVSAQVPNAFDMTMTIKDSSGTAATEMNFGQLVHVGGTPTEPYISSKSYNVWLAVSSTAGKQYFIKQGANQLLTNGSGNTIPQNAFCATTIPEGSGLNGGTLDQSKVPVGVATADRNLFTSSAAGGNAWIQVTYGITTEGGAIVPIDQPAGTYTNTVTYTAYDQ